ncbi:MAG: TetR/AcrR family transcriptional regulator C-terminal domain-containing protein [Eubacteriales bacterium]|jgi:probable dihydroxyacetone kinase regulator|nr:TetR/AcrR family transcriptional regulator C-terminal domain-containing protein [Lachnospiraceae bacterium]MDD5860895.1 TetR/AcrR family transcriptional regulator C-terminal domain-containing protein [Eubacteriales bacterium]MCH4064043.1 TetR/AcrR family transcriptional regulator C-terminal domain-containing protein [Lachnospiraceae bacterium]MCH4103232.1 TetR/AcrR family transcriptional regulator C-terminal domain-containing protein [Lachnospiraceae bacterium]MCI1309662.1 TetR/AcrR family t
MEEKKDIEHELARSLKELAVREPFEKITIKQITDGAGVIRVTFYNHFQDKYDLLEWIVRTEILEPVRILINNKMFREALILIFSNLKKDQEFYEHVVKLEGQNSFEEISYKSIRNMLYSLYRDEGAAKRLEKHPWMTLDYVADYYANSMNFVVMYWIRSGMQASPEEMETIYEYIATRSMWDVLEEFRGGKT